MPYNGKIMYCATPSAMATLGEFIEEMARERGFAPVYPFKLGPRKDFEDNPKIGRERALQFMYHIINFCDITGIFGISDGTMRELKHSLSVRKEIMTFPGLDPEWDSQYEKLKAIHGDLFAELRGPHKLIVLVGCRAVGKTFWAEKLVTHYRHSPCEHYPKLHNLLPVKNSTTRPPRSEADKAWYNFLTRDEFEKKLSDGDFFEHDEYHGCYYGMSRSGGNQRLNDHNGIFA